MGPTGSCKHIAALAYAIVDFSHCKSLPAYQTSTNMLQQWNRPCPTSFLHLKQIFLLELQHLYLMVQPQSTGSCFKTSSLRGFSTSFRLGDVAPWNA